MQTATSQQPVFLNLDFIFSWLYQHFGGIFTLQFFRVLQAFATILVILLIALIFYCLLRLYEFKQEDEKKMGSLSEYFNANEFNSNEINKIDFSCFGISEES